MKQNYKKPEMFVEEIALESMLASSDRIPVGDEVRPSAVHERRGTWGNLWE